MAARLNWAQKGEGIEYPLPGFALVPIIRREGKLALGAATANKVETSEPTEREARNRSLGRSGELFVNNYEQARLIQAGSEGLAAKIEHTSKVRGDREGYDILSFEENGSERLIEVKTTKYGGETPFFVTRNEVAASERHAARYHLYRLFAFREAPRCTRCKAPSARHADWMPKSFWPAQDDA